MQYWLQTRSSTGHWLDNLGTSHVDAAIQHGEWLVEQKKFRHDEVRVVERTDVLIWPL